MRSGQDSLAAVIRSYEQEAERLENAGPLLDARREHALQLSQRVVDKLAADVAASDAERERFVRDTLAPEVVAALGSDLSSLLAGLRSREVALTEVFSDRVLDYAEEAKSAGVAARSRAKTLRETVVALRDVEASMARGSVAEVGAPGPELAEGLPAPADGDGARLA
jgi:hypothetical protein